MDDYLLPAIGPFLVVLVIVIFICILKFCLDNQRTTKITRHRHSENCYQDVYHNMGHSPSAPLTEITACDTLGTDGFIVPSDEPSPVVVPPYPVEARHPTPQAVPLGPGFATHNPPYPTHTPHPVPGAAPYPPVIGHTPYPPASGAAPYPPTGPPGAPYPDYSAQPPSYSEAVSQPPVQPLPPKEGYSKQAPYNPNY